MSKGRKWIWLAAICLLLAGCGMSNEQPKKEALETGFIPARAGMYDSADTAIIKGINKSKQTITFFNLVREKSYTLTYDGTTKLYDKYGTSISMEQVNAGDIVDVTFLKEKKTLASLKMSESSFKIEDVRRFSLDERTKEITVGDSTYRFEDELLVFSKGRQVELMDINQVDTLVVQGIDRTVHSISVDKGHGYLRLKNDEYFWGGWIEVGQEVVRTVEEDMLLVVPEGKYNVILSTKGIICEKQVTIKRDKETELDVGDFEKEEDQKKYGNLIIAVSPDTAVVYIDGEEADISAPCKVEYGIHQLMAKAEGYQTVTQYIKVGQENAALEIVMEKQTENSVSSNSTESVSGNNATSVSGGRLTIDAPKDVEVYLDGSYIGITPIGFTKTAGVHVITLRKSGYETKSYTINVTDTKANENMSFSELVPEEEDEEEESQSNESNTSQNNNQQSNTSQENNGQSTESKEPASNDGQENEDKDSSNKTASENTTYVRQSASENDTES